MGWGTLIQKALGWEKIKEITVESDTETVTLTNLNLPPGSFGLLLAFIINPTDVEVTYGMYVENDTNVNNYFRQYFRAEGGGLGYSSGNSAQIISIPANSTGFVTVLISVSPGGKYKYFALANEGSESSQRLSFYAGTKTDTITGISQLEIFAAGDNVIGAGSKFVLLRCKGS